MKARRRARAIALQALYEIDCTDHPPDQVLQHRIEEPNPLDPDGDWGEEDELSAEASRLSNAVIDFARHLVFGVLRYQAVLDPFIQEHAPEWPLEQMACIDRTVLRLALFEFAVDARTPVKVAINEAVELAKMFGSESSARFVNGVLGALAPLKDLIAERARAHNENLAQHAKNPSA